MSEFLAKKEEIESLIKKISTIKGKLDDIRKEIVLKSKNLHWDAKEFRKNKEQLALLILVYNALIEKFKERIDKMTTFRESLDFVDIGDWEKLIKSKGLNKLYGDNSAYSESVMDLTDGHAPVQKIGSDGKRYYELSEKKDPLKDLSDAEKIKLAKKDPEFSEALVNEKYKEFIESDTYKNMLDNNGLLKEQSQAGFLLLEPEYIKYQIAKKLGIPYSFSSEFLKSNYKDERIINSVISAQEKRNNVIKGNVKQNGSDVDSVLESNLYQGYVIGAEIEKKKIKVNMKRLKTSYLEL